MQLHSTGARAPPVLHRRKTGRSPSATGRGTWRSHGSLKLVGIRNVVRPQFGGHVATERERVHPISLLLLRRNTGDVVTTDVDITAHARRPPAAAGAAVEPPAGRSERPARRWSTTFPFLSPHPPCRGIPLFMSASGHAPSSRRGCGSRWTKNAHGASPASKSHGLGTQRSPSLAVSRRQGSGAGSSDL